MPRSRTRNTTVSSGATVKALLQELEEVRARCIDAESEISHSGGELAPTYVDGARNLVHYLALRRKDLRSLQAGLTQLGLSSLGRSEAHVMDSLDAVIAVLRRLDGSGEGDGAIAFETRQKSDMSAHLRRHAERLLGPVEHDRVTRIMVTLPSEAADDWLLVTELVDAGMDIARINCAHDSPEAWRTMAKHVRRAAEASGRACLVAMDLAGPKLRTGSLPLGPAVVKIVPRRDERGNVVSPAKVWFHDGSGAATGSSNAVAVPILPRGVLSTCSVGDLVGLRDTRGAKREGQIASVEPTGVVVELTRTTYLETGTELELVTSAGTHVATVGPLPRKERAITLHVGDELVLVREGDEAVGHDNERARVACTLPEVFDHARDGHRVWFDDGKIGGVVVSCDGDEIVVRVIDAPPGGARLRGAKGINLPDTELPIPALTAHDEHSLAVAIEIADIVNVSFVRGPADVELVQSRLAAAGAEHLGLVLKIETVPGFRHLPEILLTAMRSARIGVMIARGDLAVEAGFERMAEVQEEILWLCEAAHVPVIWATQVLDQLARTGRPSRAEVTDAALAARAECIMLNKGPYIVSAIATLRDINRRMHDHQHKKQSLLRRLRAWDGDGIEA